MKVNVIFQRFEITYDTGDGAVYERVSVERRLSLCSALQSMCLLYVRKPYNFIHMMSAANQYSSLLVI